jgi:hypothetical protein
MAIIVHPLKIYIYRHGNRMFPEFAFDNHDYMELHIMVFGWIVKHTKFKLFTQLVFGGLLSFCGVLLLTKFQYFRNNVYKLNDDIPWLPDWVPSWESTYGYWFRDSMPGLLIIASAVVAGLYVILSIHSKDKEREREERKEIVKALTELPNNMIEAYKKMRAEDSNNQKGNPDS